MKSQINLLEKAFRGSLTEVMKRELNKIRRNGMTGQVLLKTLTHLYYQHSMRDWVERRDGQHEDQPIPKIVCSEGLV